MEACEADPFAAPGRHSDKATLYRRRQTGLPLGGGAASMPTDATTRGRSDWKEGGLLAVGAALVFGGGLYGLTHWVAPDSGMLLASFLFGAPVGCCVVASLVSHRRRPMRISGHVGLSALVITGLLVGGAVALRETAICLVMAAPLFYGAGLTAGAVMGAILSRPGGGGVACIAILAPLLFLPIEATGEPPVHHGAVTTIMEIAAPPEVVWAHTVEIPGIRAEELKPTFSHVVAGVPSPVEAVMSGEGPGAVRKLRWNGGIRFEEHVTAWETNRRLAWKFRFSPTSVPTRVERHIRLDGDYLRLTDGDYRLEPLPGGRTRLTLTTRYWFASPINGYCEWWAQRFFGDFHGAVLGVIKQRAEAVS